MAAGPHWPRRSLDHALFFVIATNVALILMITVFRRKILDA